MEVVLSKTVLIFMYNGEVCQTRSSFADSWCILNQLGVKLKHYQYIHVFPLDSQNLITCDAPEREGGLGK
jgi:hypothetical protein